MKKKICYMLILIGMILLGSCKEKKFMRDEQDFESNITEQEAVLEQNIQSEEEILQSQMGLATHGCVIVQEGETLSLNGMNVTVNAVTITRKKGEWHDFLSQELDENGCLSEDRAYVIVNVTIEQVGDADFWLNSIWLAFFGDDLKIGPIELDGTSLFKKDDRNPDAYRGLIKKGETLTTDLVYVIKKEEAGEDAHFLLEYNPTGCSLDYVESEEYGMIYLKSLEGVWNEIPMEE